MSRKVLRFRALAAAGVVVGVVGDTPQGAFQEEPDLSTLMDETHR